MTNTYDWIEGKVSLSTLRRLAAWGLRLAVLAHVCAWIAPLYPRAVLGPPQVVETAHAMVCVHTRLTDEIEPWKLQRTLQLVREMGAATIVEYFPWAYVEGAKGRFDWWHADQVMTHAQNQGLRVLARIGMVPEWARPDPEVLETTGTYLDEEHFADFAAFVGEFVARYASVLDGVIVWNEPNLSFEWGYRPVDPVAYTRLLRATYAEIKAADPNVLVLAGALAPTLEPPGSPNGLNDLIYLEEMYRAGAAGFFDALAVHTYGFKFAPEADPAPDVLNFRRAELLRAVMAQNGDEDKPVFITEAGWNDHPRWTRAVRPGQRIAYTLDAFRWAEDQWNWAERLCIWAFRYPVAQRNWRDYFTLVTPDFRAKPIYEAVRAYARGWETAP